MVQFNDSNDTNNSNSPLDSQKSTKPSRFFLTKFLDIANFGLGCLSLCFCLFPITLPSRPVTYRPDNVKKISIPLKPEKQVKVEKMPNTFK